MMSLGPQSSSSSGYSIVTDIIRRATSSSAAHSADSNSLTLLRVLRAYNAVLQERQMVPEQDHEIYKILLSLSQMETHMGKTLSWFERWELYQKNPEFAVPQLSVNMPSLLDISVNTVYQSKMTEKTALNSSNAFRPSNQSALDQTVLISDELTHFDNSTSELRNIQNDTAIDIKLDEPEPRNSEISISENEKRLLRQILRSWRKYSLISASKRNKILRQWIHAVSYCRDRQLSRYWKIWMSQYHQIRETYSIIARRRVISDYFARWKRYCNETKLLAFQFRRRRILNTVMLTWMRRLRDRLKFRCLWQTQGSALVTKFEMTRKRALLVAWQERYNYQIALRKRKAALTSTCHHYGLQKYFHSWHSKYRHQRILKRCEMLSRFRTQRIFFKIWQENLLRQRELSQLRDMFYYLRQRQLLKTHFEAWHFELTESRKMKTAENIFNFSMLKRSYRLWMKRRIQIHNAVSLADMTFNRFVFQRWRKQWVQIEYRRHTLLSFTKARNELLLRKMFYTWKSAHLDRTAIGWHSAQLKSRHLQLWRSRSRYVTEVLSEKASNYLSCRDLVRSSNSLRLWRKNFIARRLMHIQAENRERKLLLSTSMAKWVSRTQNILLLSQYAKICYTRLQMKKVIWEWRERFITHRRNRKLSLQKWYLENEPKRRLIKAFRGWKLYTENEKSKRITYELLASQVKLRLKKNIMETWLSKTRKSIRLNSIQREFQKILTTSRLRHRFHGWRIKFQHQLDTQLEAIRFDYSNSLRNSFIHWTNQAAKSRLMRASEYTFQLRRKKRLVGVMLKSWNQLSTNSARLRKTTSVIQRQHNFILLDHSWYIWKLALRLRHIKELESQFSRIRRGTWSSTLKKRCLLNWKHAFQFRKQQKRRSERVFIRNFKSRYFNRWHLKTQELQYKFDQLRCLHNKNILHASFQQWLERVKHERIKRKEVVIRAWLKDVKSRQLRLMIRGWRNVTRKNAYRDCLLTKVTAQRNEVRIRHAFRIWKTVTFEAKCVRESLEKANYNRRQQYLRRWARVYLGIREKNNRVIIEREQYTQRNAFMKWYSRFLRRKRAEQTMERFLLRKKQERIRHILLTWMSYSKRKASLHERFQLLSGYVEQHLQQWTFLNWRNKLRDVKCNAFLARRERRTKFSLLIRWILQARLWRRREIAVDEEMKKRALRIHLITWRRKSRYKQYHRAAVQHIIARTQKSLLRDVFTVWKARYSRAILLQHSERKLRHRVMDGIIRRCWNQWRNKFLRVYSTIPLLSQSSEKSIFSANQLLTIPASAQHQHLALDDHSFSNILQIHPMPPAKYESPASSLCEEQVNEIQQRRRINIQRQFLTKWLQLLPIRQSINKRRWLRVILLKWSSWAKENRREKLNALMSTMKSAREERLLRLYFEKWRTKAEEESENRELRRVMLRRSFYTWEGLTKMIRSQRLKFATRCIEIWKTKVYQVLDNKSKAANLSDLKIQNRYFYLWHQKISTRRKSNLIKRKLELELNSENQRRASLLRFGWKKWRKGTKVRNFDTKRKLIYAQSYYLKTLKRRVLLSWFNGTHKTFSSTILGSSLDQR